uniref:Reverse transcriptase/retrotransposon-derived protein RNase H-like domain-containing protein n=1 Tax=Trichuris muris TaxID=70415 RepID=A0A5S6QKS1_TRIMR
MKLDLGLGRDYTFTFLVANVPVAILGADFLRQHGLVPDLQAGCLRDECTAQCIPACGPNRPGRRAIVQVTLEHNVPAPPRDGVNFRHFRRSSLFRSLLDPPGEFPAVTTPGVEHTIETRGRPVYARARRLMPDKLAAAKKELQELLKRGILVPSHSSWSSRFI